MVLYPSNSLHRVTPVTRGARVWSFFWLHSVVRSDAHRTLLGLPGLLGQEDASVITLTGAHHNLLREWAEA